MPGVGACVAGGGTGNLAVEGRGVVELVCTPLVVLVLWVDSIACVGGFSTTAVFVIGVSIPEADNGVDLLSG